MNLPPIPPSIRVFSNESTLHMRWPKYWSFSLSINPSNEYSGLISFRMDWLDLLVVQGILESLLQHHSSKATSLRHSAFFIVQLSHIRMCEHTHMKALCWWDKSYKERHRCFVYMYDITSGWNVKIPTCRNWVEWRFPEARVEKRGDVCQRMQNMQFKGK